MYHTLNIPHAYRVNYGSHATTLSKIYLLYLHKNKKRIKLKTHQTFVTLQICPYFSPCMHCLLLTSR